MVPRRILLLITDLEIGGTPAVVRELAVRLNTLPGVVAEVACLSRWGPVAAQLHGAGVRVTPLNASRTLDLPGVIWRLVKLIRRGPLRGPESPPAPDRVLTYETPRSAQWRGFDTVFSFLVHANVVAAMASPLCRGVRFLQSIQTTQPDPEWHWRAQELAATRAERVVVPSPSVAAVASRWAGVPSEKIVVVPNAIDVHQFLLSPVPANDPRPYPIGFIGRLDPIKRVPDLVDAVGRLDGLVHLHVFGEGTERTAIENRVAELGLRGHVTFHGAVARPQDALSKVGLLVLPSQAEGFGLVLIEAMAAGVPVVATAVPGIRDVVRDGRTGLLVPCYRPDLLAGAIRAVVEKPDLRHRLTEAARADVRKRFSWEAALADYRRVLNL